MGVYVVFIKLLNDCEVVVGTMVLGVRSTADEAHEHAKAWCKGVNARMSRRLVEAGDIVYFHTECAF
ncbi:hypothetical protein LCGC14_2920150 [marine sediment metagenome]|uniref:Uncharacterized protein n=1 Tax=marine sediment metagenome TaxID=412755 RepID=A0A0F8YAV7_9ZZZZ